MQLQLLFPKTGNGDSPQGESDFPERQLLITMQTSPVFSESAGHGSSGCCRFAFLQL